MATLSEKIIAVNNLGRSNLVEKGVELGENATTYEIMQSIADVSGGGGGVEYTSIVYNEDNSITLTDRDGTEHTMICTYDEGGKLIGATYDGKDIDLTYDGDVLVNVGKTEIGMENVPSSSGGTDTLTARITNTLTEYVTDEAITLPTHCFYDATNLTRFVAPNLVALGGSSTFYKCSNLDYVDFGNIKSLSGGNLNLCHNITTIILRKTDSVVSLSSAFTNNNSITKDDYTVGGNPCYCCIYVPQALLEDYKVAKNWTYCATHLRAIEDYPEITGG